MFICTPLCFVASLLASLHVKGETSKYQEQVSDYREIRQPDQGSRTIYATSPLLFPLARWLYLWT